MQPRRRSRANRDQHLTIVQEAQEGYRERLIRELKTKLHLAETGARVDPFIRLRVPESHVDDFDRVIEMLEMTTGDHVGLTEAEFRCYIRNNWRWSQGFLEANAGYSQTASALFEE